VTLAGVSAEYIWTGTEWKWKNPETPGGSSDTLGSNTDLLDSNSEGSGDGNTWDDEDSYDDNSYDDNYDDYEEEIEVSKQNNNNKYDFNDYNKNTKKEKKQKEKKNRNKNRDSQFYPSNSNSAILPASDDEDLFNGSGDDYDADYDDYITPTFNKPTTESPPKTNNPTVNEDEDDYDDYETYVYGDDDITFNPDFNLPTPDAPITTTTTSTTIRSFTTKKPSAPRTSRPEAGPGRGAHNPIPVNRPASFFAQPGILAAVIGGAVVGLLCAILLVMFIVYRMRKKDEGSYALDDSKRSHNVNSYSKPPNREFYA